MTVEFSSVSGAPAKFARAVALPQEIAGLCAAISGRYEMVRELGRGGMATVYLARDVKHDRLVALKVLNPELGAVLGSERFLTEIRVTANLQHPHLLPLFDSGEAEGLLFYVMPYVEGESLRARLDREKQLPVDEAVRIAVAVAQALEYAHGHGVIHRDLKPENILLQAGQPVVADFGIALAVSNAGGQRITQTGLSLGTPQYMSPEQATGDRVIDARSDIYSLAAVLYEMLTGEPPHLGTTAQAIIAKVLTEKPRPVRAARDTVPAHVEEAIDRALAKLPADRFATAGELAAELQVAPRFGAAAASDGRGARLPIWRTRAGLGVTAMAFAVLGLAIWGTRTLTLRDARRDVPDLQLLQQLTFDATAESPALSPDGQWLAYVTGDCTSATACAFTLRVREVNGAQSVRLGTWGGDVIPHWSPDGTMLVVTVSPIADPDSAERGVYLMDRLGGAVRRLTAQFGEAAFSPDGRSVILARLARDVHPQQPQALVRYDVATLAPVDSVLLPAHAAFGDFAFDPSGRRFVAFKYGTHEIHLVLMTAHGQILDSLPVDNVRKPAWEPSGAAVDLWQGTTSSRSDLVRVPIRADHFRWDARSVRLGQVQSGFDTDLGSFDISTSTGEVAVVIRLASHALRELQLASGGGWKVLARRGGVIEPQQITADGASLLADATDNLGQNVYLFPLNGGDPHAITAAKGNRWAGELSPDGRRIMYFRERPAPSGFALMDADGGRERLIMADPGYSQVAWRGDNAVAQFTANWDSLLVFDTTGTRRESVAVPPQYRQRGVEYMSVAADPATKRVAFWSGMAGAIVTVDVGKHTFTTLVRSSVPLAPRRWVRDGSLMAVREGSLTGNQGGPDSTSDHLVRVRPGGGAPEMMTSLPSGCDPVIDDAATRVVCSTVQWTSDIWLAGRPGRSGQP